METREVLLENGQLVVSTKDTEITIKTKETPKRGQNRPKNSFRKGEIVYYQNKGIWKIGRFLRTEEGKIIVNKAAKIEETIEVTLSEENTPMKYFPLTGAKPITPEEAPKRWGYFNEGQVVFNGKNWGKVKRIKGVDELEVVLNNGEIEYYTLEGCPLGDETNRVLSYTEDRTLASAFPADMIDYDKVPLGTPIIVSYQENINSQNKISALATSFGASAPRLYGVWGAKIETKVGYSYNYINPNGRTSFSDIEHISLYIPTLENKRKRRRRSSRNRK